MNIRNESVAKIRELFKEHIKVAGKTMKQMATDIGISNVTFHLFISKNQIPDIKRKSLYIRYLEKNLLPCVDKEEKPL